MTTVTEDLQSIYNIKQEIALAIEGKGVDMNGTTLDNFPFKINQIQTGSGNVWLSKDFLDGTFNLEDYYLLLNSIQPDTNYPLNYNVTPGDEIIQVMVYTPNNSQASTCKLYVNTTEVLDENGGPLDTFRVDWGDGTIRDFPPGTEFQHTFDNSTGDLGEYVTITIRPINGAHLTGFDSSIPPSTWPAGTYYYSCINKILVNGSFITDLWITDQFVTGHPILTEVYIGENSSPMTPAMFFGANSLRYIPRLETSHCTDFTSMFEQCSSLIVVPPLDDRNVVSHNSMFSGASQLVCPPPMTFWSTLDTGNAFSESGIVNCYDLYELGLNVAPGSTTICVAMFSNCKNLKRLPSVHGSSILSTMWMFSGCTSAQAAGTYDIANCTNGTGMFRDCRAMVYLSSINTSKMDSVRYMFAGCANLKDVAIDLSVADSYISLFNGCFSLTRVTIGRMKTFITFSQPGTDMFTDCINLMTVDTLGWPAYLNRYKLIGRFRKYDLDLLFDLLPAWDGYGSNIIDLTGVYGIDLTTTSYLQVYDKGYVTLPATIA